jgi:hypothetical protein
MKPSSDKRKTAAAATWEPPRPAEHGRLHADQVNPLPASAFAFPHSRKEPMTDASHVRNAIARFDQVKDVSDAERELAFANIQRAATHFGIHMKETDWHQLGPNAERASP